ncbi:protein shisa-5-like [Myripristis murdjan]|uniref:protein shisa-5-like n=1 Tax=Myripristis murdjan TaxID=586833 RepID=UPI001175D9A1|nr:protein shisa-5-like [Myripristis murdjan]
MDLRVSSSLALALLCVTLFPSISADYCTSYWDRNGQYHDLKQCGFDYCCGNCYQKYCCSDSSYRLTADEQRRCPERPVHGGGKSFFTILGSVLGSVFPVITCVGIVICCLCPCCLLYKKCRKRGSRGHQTVVINPPPQPPTPSGYPQPYYGDQYPDFRLLQLQAGPGATAPPPPPYLEDSPPGSSAVPVPYDQIALAQGQPEYPSQSDFAQPPYNPSFIGYPNP